MSPLSVVLRQLDLAYSGKAWHGPTLRGSVRGLDLATTAFRPAPGRRNIWEIAVHAAYWKYTVRRRLLGEKRGSFPLQGSNWFARPVERTEAAWKEDVALLEEMHRTLRQAVAGLDEAALTITPKGSKVNNLDLLIGIAQHDVYHAGQIQVLKRLAAG